MINKNERRAFCIAFLAAIFLHSILIFGFNLFKTDKVRMGDKTGALNTRIVTLNNTPKPALEPANTVAESIIPVEKEVIEKTPEKIIEQIPKEVKKPEPKVNQKSVEKPKLEPVDSPTDNINDNVENNSENAQDTAGQMAKGQSDGVESEFASLYENTPMAAVGGSRSDTPAKSFLSDDVKNTAFEIALKANDGDIWKSKIPPGVTIEYSSSGDFEGRKVTGLSEFAFRRDDNFYEADWVNRHMDFKSFKMVSTGLLAENGQIIPVHSMNSLAAISSQASDDLYKRAGNFIQNKFLYDENKIYSFSPENVLDLQAGAQDNLSAIIQLAAWFNADAKNFPVGRHFSLPVVQNGIVSDWVWNVDISETIVALGGKLVKTIKLSHSFDIDEIKASISNNQAPLSKLEIWLAPELEYMPARMRFYWANAAGEPSFDFLAKSARLNRNFNRK